MFNVFNFQTVPLNFIYCWILNSNSLKKTVIRSKVKLGKFFNSRNLKKKGRKKAKNFLTAEI